MRQTPHYITSDVEFVKRLVRENPWGTFVAHTAAGLVASHYPIALEEDAEGISILSHVGRPDDRALELGRAEMLLIVQGVHGYISPGWYPPGDDIPTWNHVTAHLYGVPETLPEEENFRVLGDLVDHFERRMPEPRSLARDEASARGVARGTVGLRLRVTRFDARLKLSQNRPEPVRQDVIAGLRADGPYRNPALAAEMERVSAAEHAR